MDMLDNNIFESVNDDNHDKLKHNLDSLEDKANINNIFYSNFNCIQRRFNDNVSKDTLYKEFGNPFIVCLKNSVACESYFYDQIITNEQLTKLKTSIVVMPTSYKIINKTAYKYLTIIGVDIFNSLNVFDKFGKKIIINKEVIIYCLLMFNKSNIDKYLKQFEGIGNFYDFYNSFVMNDYLHQMSNSPSIIQNHIQMISTMTETNYYTNYYNCQLNISTKFKLRNFNINIQKIFHDKPIGMLTSSETNSNDEKEINNNSDDYISALFKSSSFVDASSSSNSFKIMNNPVIKSIGIENFNKLYDKLPNIEKYYLIMNSMISKDLCHFVINNKYILNDIMSKTTDNKGFTFMDKYEQIIRYTLGYTWITFYMEESIKRGYINKTDRFIFNIETASMLPFYAYSKQNLHICPYLPLLIDKKTLNAENNILGVQQIKFDNNINNLTEYNHELTRYGITDKKTFIDRINIFISGKLNNNILKDVNWTNIAMCGSIMACCLPNFNSLMANFFISDDNIDFNGFVEEYYNESDIDIIYNDTDIHKFVDKIYEFKNTIENNIKIIHNLQSDIPNITSLFSNKTAVIQINKYFIKTYLQQKTNINTDKEYLDTDKEYIDTDKEYLDILTNINTPKIKKIIYKHYIEWYKLNIIESIKTNPQHFINNKYHELYLPVSIENINIVFIKTYVDNKEDEHDNKIISDVESDNDKENNEEYEEITYKNIKLTNPEYSTNNIVFIPKINFKFRISSFYLPHNFEFFQIKYTEFFSTVAKFHLPIVRSYYDGTDVLLTPSCISACMTMLNIDYKYFASTKDPIEIINKYRMRGFGTILNNNEIMRLIEYSQLVPKWKHLYLLNIKTKNKRLMMFGQLDINNNLFKPSKVLHNKEPTIKYIPSYALEYKIIPYQPRENKNVNQKLNKTFSDQLPNITNNTTINENGFINPVKKWLIDAYYDYGLNIINHANN